jgi:hypothetical protein
MCKNNKLEQLTSIDSSSTKRETPKTKAQEKRTPPLFATNVTKCNS